VPQLAEALGRKVLALFLATLAGTRRACQPWTFPVCKKIGVGVGCEMGRDQVQVSTFTVHNLRPVSTACNHDISHN
jgi:hypothetical protein